jgi:hypothetical protein
MNLFPRVAPFLRERPEGCSSLESSGQSLFMGLVSFFAQILSFRDVPYFTEGLWN